MKKPTFLEATVKENTRSRKAETLRSPQKPPVAASRAREAVDSSNLKDARPNETTMVK
jgi:hypothetical protein